MDPSLTWVFDQGMKLVVPYAYFVLAVVYYLEAKGYTMLWNN